jgi:septum site-determining protein MinD
MGKTIGIISIKGGVGKTSVTSSLGAALANKFGKKVLVIDGNFSSPNIGLHLGLYNPSATIHDLIEGKVNAKDAIFPSSFGFDVIAGALSYDKINPLKLAEKIRDLRRLYDIILIDSSPNLNEEILGAMMASDELLVVTTPDHVTLATTMRAIKLAKEKRTPITGLILNKVHNKKFELSLKQIEQVSGCPILAIIPHELHVLKSLSKTMPSSIDNNTASTREYNRLAASILGQEYKESWFNNFVSRFSATVPQHEVNRTIFKNERQSNPFYA